MKGEFLCVDVDFLRGRFMASHGIVTALAFETWNVELKLMCNAFRLTFTIEINFNFAIYTVLIVNWP